MKKWIVLATTVAVLAVSGYAVLSNATPLSSGRCIPYATC